MATEVVPTGDERCDICAGRKPINHMCELCFYELKSESGLQGKLTYGIDDDGRRFIDEIPDDPSQNEGDRARPSPTAKRRP